MKFSVVDGRIFNPGDLSWDGFRALAEVTVTNFETEPPLAAVIDCLQGSQGAMLRQWVVKQELLEACPELKFITLTSTGYDQVDREALDYAARARRDHLQHPRLWRFGGGPAHLRPAAGAV